METYSQYGMIRNNKSTNLEVQKAVLEMASHIPLSLLSKEALELVDWANRFDNRDDLTTVKGEKKVSGRPAYKDSDPKLVMKVRELRSKKLKNREISDKLFLMGWKTSTGNKFNTGMITKLYRQSEILVKKGA